MPVLPEYAPGDGLGSTRLPHHSVWGRVIPDIPDFRRELVAALLVE